MYNLNRLSRRYFNCQHFLFVYHGSIRQFFMITIIAFFQLKHLISKTSGLEIFKMCSTIFVSSKLTEILRNLYKFQFILKSNCLNIWYLRKFLSYKKACAERLHEVCRGARMDPSDQVVCRERHKDQNCIPLYLFRLKCTFYYKAL